MKPRALIALDIALACLGSADVALRTFLDIDISADEQRARLVADISDVVLLGVMLRD